MNIEQLKKNIGELLRLRPHPQRVESYGSGVSVLTSGGPRYEKDVVHVDYDWVLEDVTAKAVTLACPFTGHRVALGPTTCGTTARRTS
jgi:hypothetical protein